MDIIRFSVYEDEEKARVEEQKLKLKGYQVEVEVSRNIVVNTIGLGGKLEYLNDPDGDAFVLIAKK